MTGGTRGASAASLTAASMSSGSASTTGPGPARAGGRVGARDQLGDAVGAVDLRHPLRERPEHPPVVDLLERLTLLLNGRHLADEQDHRRRVLERRVHADRRLRRAWPARDHANARPPGQLAVRLGHVRRARLVAAGDQAGSASRRGRRAARCSSRRERRTRPPCREPPAGRRATCRRARLTDGARSRRARAGALASRRRQGRRSESFASPPTPAAARARARTPSPRSPTPPRRPGRGRSRTTTRTGRTRATRPGCRSGCAPGAAPAAPGRDGCAGARRSRAESRRGRSAGATAPAGRSVSSHTSARPWTRAAPTSPRPADEAYVGAASVEGRALVWELTSRPAGRVAPPLRPGRLPARRCRVPAHASRPGAPGAPAGPYSTSTPRAPRTEYGPFEWWYETFPDPVFAAASETEPRWRSCACSSCRRSGRGSARIAYVDPADEEKPKLQRAHVYLRAPALSRHGGQLLADQLAVHGAELAFGVPGESYLARARRRSTTSPIRSSPAATRAAPPTWPRPTASSPGGRALLRHARARARRTPRRRPHRVPGLDADDPARRPGRARPGGARGVPGDRLPAHVRADGEVGRADRRRRPHPRVRRARLPRPRCAGRPGPGRARAARGHAGRRESTSPTRRRSSVVAAAARPRRDARGAARAARGGGAAVRARRRRRLDAEAARRHARASLEANELPVGARSAARTRSTTTRPATPATSASASTRRSPSASASADLLLVVGARLGEMTTCGYTLSTCRCRGRRWSTSMPAPRSSAASTRPRCRSSAGMAQFAAAVRDLRVEPRWARVDGRRRAPTTRRGSSTAAMPGAVDLGDVHRPPARAPARRRDRHQRRRQLRGLGRTASAAYRGFRPSSRRRAARWATACRRRSRRRPPRPSATVVCFAGDGDFLMTRAGARDRGAVRPADRRHRRRQRHVRDDPHAPGAALPGRVVGTELVNPDFARLRPRLRRARRDGRARPTISPTAFERALAAGGPALIELRIDPEAITPADDAERDRGRAALREQA